MLTPKQAWAIAHLVAELRPEWDAEGVVAALKRCADRDPFLTALAAVRAAADTRARTPGVIPTDGTHWQDGIKSRETPRSYDVPCPDHPGEILPCGRCAADAVPAAKSDALALARAELAQAKANQCTHGIDRRRGACGECGAAAAKSTETETKTSETKES